MNQKTNQKHITAQGDVVGGDKTVIQSAQLTPMSALIRKFRQELEEDKQLKTYIDELQHLVTLIDDEEFVGLETKLAAAERQDQIEYAKRLKQIFFKKLTRYQTSPTAQEIYAYLLGDMLVKFNNCVWPLILDEVDRATIDKALQDEVISPMTKALEENVLELYPQDVAGMVYFLTGNCHIKWSS